MKLTYEEKELLFELIFNEQTKYLIAKNKYDTNRYNALEKLKVKLKTM
jgi:hypothetical protein